MENLRRSEIVISAILAFLLERGIQRGDMDVHSIDLTDEEEPFFEECFKWLLAEGIVRANRVVETLGGGLTVFDPQITSRGFMMLGHEIDFAGTKKTIGSAVQDIARDKQSYSQIGDFVGSLLGGFTKSLGS